jgi:hypothetical protein
METLVVVEEDIATNLQDILPLDRKCLQGHKGLQRQGVAAIANGVSEQV